MPDPLPIELLANADSPVARVRRRVAQATRTAATRFREALEDGAKWVWSNPDGLTPQEAVDALGADAAAVFAEHARASAYLQSVTGEAPFLPPLLPIPNSDGTITLQPWPESQPE